MTWGGSEAFFAMGGYALYVWGSYGLTAVLIMAEIVVLVLRRRSLTGRPERVPAVRGGQ